MFPRQDFLCTLVCDSAYDCKGRCIAEFGHDAYRCLYPGGDASHSGCLLAPPTAHCPTNGPKVLDRGDHACCLDPQSAACASHEADTSATCTYFNRWKAGEWAGDPEWKALAQDIVYERVFLLLSTCMAMVGTGQPPCGNQEQGLQAAWLALDPDGENADQAKAFLRPDALLLIVVVSTEDDCSTTSPIAAELFPQCACLADTNGCRADGTCGITTLDLGGLRKDARVLVPTSSFVNHFKSLKANPSMVYFAAITGDVIPATPTSPNLPDGSLPAVDDIRARYFDCKCPQPKTPYSPMTYACQSSTGKADLGKRYIDVAAAFGEGHGMFANICEGLPAALARFAGPAIVR
jgi:hypothetical protein